MNKVSLTAIPGDGIGTDNKNYQPENRLNVCWNKKYRANAHHQRE
jgi:hypothetical protein